MKQSYGKKLTSRAMSNLLRDRTNRLDPQLSREFMCSFYVFEDGGAALVEDDGSGLHFSSCDDLLSRHRANVKNVLLQPNELAELLPHAEVFQTQVPTLVADLPRLLGIDAKFLNFSEESLDAIDEAIRRLGSERILTPEIFPSLTAYVGEVIRRQVNGSWEIRTTRAGLRHEPDIIDPTGGRYGLLRIYKQLLEYGRTASMRAFVHAALTTHRLLPRH